MFVIFSETAGQFYVSVTQFCGPIWSCSSRLGVACAGEFVEEKISLWSNVFMRIVSFLSPSHNSYFSELYLVNAATIGLVAGGERIFEGIGHNPFGELLFYSKHSYLIMQLSFLRLIGNSIFSNSFI